MSLNDKIAQELNHFLKIINYKDSAQPDESLNDEDKKKSISLMRVNASGEVSAQACMRASLELAASTSSSRQLCS